MWVLSHSWTLLHNITDVLANEALVALWNTVLSAPLINMIEISYCVLEILEARINKRNYVFRKNKAFPLVNTKLTRMCDGLLLELDLDTRFFDKLLYCRWRECRAQHGFNCTLCGEHREHTYIHKKKEKENKTKTFPDLPEYGTSKKKQWKKYNNNNKRLLNKWWY